MRRIRRFELLYLTDEAELQTERVCSLYGVGEAKEKDEEDWKEREREKGERRLMEELCSRIRQRGAACKIDEHPSNLATVSRARLSLSLPQSH